MKFLVLHANNAVPKVCSLFFQQWQPPNIENWRGEAVADLGGGGGTRGCITPLLVWHL